MNVNRYILASIVVFIFFFVVEWIFHGLIMSGWYGEHLEMFRPRAEAGTYAVWMILGFLILAFGFSLIFAKGYENKGIAEGFRYGLYVGIAFAVSTLLVNYAVFPYPAKWLIGWIIGYVIILILGGMIVAAIYKPKALGGATPAS